MIALQLFAVLALVGINAFFSAAEFSLVAVRQSRVRQLVEKGDARAKIVEQLLTDLSRVVSGVQVGITLASLSLGYLGEVTLAGILIPLVRAIPRPWAALIAHGAALAIAFGLLTVLQVVLGELVPKSLSLARAERVALLVARPFHWFLHTFRWAIDLLDRFAEKIVPRAGRHLAAQPHVGAFDRRIAGDDSAGARPRLAARRRSEIHSGGDGAGPNPGARSDGAAAGRARAAGAARAWKTR